VDGEIVGAIGLSGRPTVARRHYCVESTVALVSDRRSGGLKWLACGYMAGADPLCGELAVQNGIKPAQLLAKVWTSLSAILPEISHEHVHAQDSPTHSRERRLHSLRVLRPASGASYKATEVRSA